jgi:hypothetical protein
VPAAAVAQLVAIALLAGTVAARSETAAAASGSGPPLPETGLAVGSTDELAPGLTPPSREALNVTLAGTRAHIDGISDQNLQAWGPYFSAFFRDSWVDGVRAPVTLSRYVVQWNVLSGGYPAYLAKYEAWYAATSALGLTAELAVTSYDTVLPKSTSEYQEKIEGLLGLKPVRYFEAWNEPNKTPFLPPATAAHFTNAAYSLCQREGCTLIAGDLLDSPNMVGYEIDYEKDLSPPNPPNWRIHPYYAVKAQSAAPVTNFRANLPNSADAIWFTEIGAYNCVHGEQLGELHQAIEASWLVNMLVPSIEPAHVIYYEYLDGNPPPCSGSDADTALYLAGRTRGAPDYPRPAANYVFTGRAVPSAYTGPASAAASAAGSSNATLTGSVDPGGFFDTRYHFEYGPTTAYGSFSAEADAGSRSGAMAVASATGGLTPGVSYHYRLLAWNKEGTSEEGPSVGADRTFQAGAEAGPRTSSDR